MRPSPLSRSLLAVAAAAVVLVAAALALSTSAPTSRATVAVTSYPLLDIVRSVAGPDLPVASVLPPGGNPHTFEATPSTISLLSDAQVVYAIGHGFDDWIDGVLRETDAVKVVVDGGIALRESREATHDEGAEEEEEEGHEDGPVDPHYWLDARNAAQIARTVAADLSARFPGRKDAIAANLEATVARFADADREARAILAGVPNRKIVTLHDAWYYFADAYGLEIVGSFEPTAAREPSSRYLTALENAVRAAGATTLYAEPGVTTAAIRAFIQDNGLTIAELDPLEGADDAPYDEILLRNVRTIKAHQR